MCLCLSLVNFSTFSIHNFKRQKSLVLLFCSFLMSFAICAVHCFFFSFYIYIDWQQRQPMCSVHNFFPLRSFHERINKWNEMKWNLKKKCQSLHQFFSFCLLLFLFSSVRRIVLIIIQDQVYWKKWRYNEKKTHTPSSLEIEEKKRKSYIILSRVCRVDYCALQHSHSTKHTIWVCLCVVFLQMIYS